MFKLLNKENNESRVKITEENYFLKIKLVKKN